MGGLQGAVPPVGHATIEAIPPRSVNRKSGLQMRKKLISSDHKKRPCELLIILEAGSMQMKQNYSNSSTSSAQLRNIHKYSIQMTANDMQPIEYLFCVRFFILCFT